MLLGTKEKQPSDKLDFDIDYSRWLRGTDDTLDAVTVDEVAPAGLEVVSTTVSPRAVKLWLRGGVDGTTYKITVTVVTAGFREKQDEIRIKVKER